MKQAIRRLRNHNATATKAAGIPTPAAEAVLAPLGIRLSRWLPPAHKAPNPASTESCPAYKERAAGDVPAALLKFDGAKSYGF